MGSAPEAPRLLYVGDVPVESSYHGSALLYRLLDGYPAERLRIVETSSLPSLAARRLPGVAYAWLSTTRARLLNSRLHRPYSLWLTLRARHWAKRVPRLIAGFEPQAVLTVAHGHLWITAAELARRSGLPLHLIVHDDWPRVARLPAPFGGRVERDFRRIYREADSRLCISPFMVEEFRRRYDVEGEVLYPSRARDASVHPPAPQRTPARGLVLAFAGTINSPDYARMLRALAGALEPRGGKLLLFGPLQAAAARAGDLAHPGIELCGLLPSAELAGRLRRDADVLYVPMSFAPGDRANMEISFPSKIADYTAVGLPLLIQGPSYCSAVRWAQDNAGAAEVVVDRGEGGLAQALDRLAADPAHRNRLAIAAGAAGERYFAHAAAQRVFHAALGRPREVRRGERPATC